MNSYVNDFTTTVKSYYKDIKSFNPLSKDEEKALMLKAKNNDVAARNKILTANLKFVFSVAKKYTGKGVSIDDLISEGNLGLIHAYDKFDVSKDVKFFSYAVWWINFYMQDYIKKRRTVDEVEMSEVELYTPHKSNSTEKEEETISYCDTIGADTEDFAEIDELKYKKEILCKLLAKLTPRERLIIESYFGLNGQKNSTLDECGKKLGLSPERCRQIKSKSLLKLRSEMMLLI